MELILCDDHPIVMASLAAMFEAHGHDVVGMVSHPDALADVVRDLGGDVCVTDLLFGDEQEPHAVLGAITEVARLSDVVVLTGADRHHCDAASRAGATAVGSKALPSEAILALVEGRAPSADSSIPDRPAGAPFFLTSREVEVLQSLSDGDSTARMAERLGVRHSTARSHVQSVLHKLGVHNRLAAVSVAVSHGLIEVPG